MKALYRDLGLEQLYRSYEESSIRKFTEKIQNEADIVGLPKELFFEFASRIYKRVS